MTLRKKKGWWMLPFLAFMIIYGVFSFTSQSDELYQINLKIKELEQKIEAEKARQQELMKQKDDILSDESIEKLAREKLGMVRDGERVFVDTNK
jgi:cell division protein FtsL